MSRRTRWAIVVVLVVLVVAGVVAAVLVSQQGPATVVVRRGSLEATVQTVGHLTPTDPVAVTAAVSGQVSLVAVSPGDQVQAGDVLATLDQQPFRDAIAHAQQQVYIAETALNSAEQQGGASPSPQQVAARLTASENLKAAHQALDAADTALTNTFILAPAAGTVLSVTAAKGAPVAQGTVVAQIANLSNLSLQIDLDEVDLPHVTPGMPVSFTVDAYPGHTIDGKLASIAPSAVTSGGSTTFQGNVSFTLPDGLELRPGMSANVSIKTAVRNNVLLIPQSAILTVGQRTFVTVVSNGHSQQREIKTGLSSGGLVEVASGLSAGERIAAQP